MSVFTSENRTCYIIDFDDTLVPWSTNQRHDNQVNRNIFTVWYKLNSICKKSC